jgi:hypothetical protein
MKNLNKLLVSQQIRIKRERLAMIKKIANPNAFELDRLLRPLFPKSKENHIFESISMLKEYLIKRLEIKIEDKIKQDLIKLEFSESLQPLSEVIITVEWKKSKMWGSNPTAESYVSGLGFLTSGSIGGCGYDKQSTAVAAVMN